MLALLLISSTQPGSEITRSFDGKTQDTKQYDPHYALFQYYNWAVEHLVQSMIPLADRGDFPLANGMYLCNSPKKVTQWEPGKMKTLSTPLAPISIGVGYLGGDYQAQGQENSLIALQVTAYTVSMLLIPVGILPNSTQAGKEWANYLAVDLYESNGVGSYVIVSICTQTDTEIVVGSTIGYLGVTLNSEGNPVDLGEIYGREIPQYGRTDRFYGKLIFTNPIRR